MSSRLHFSTSFLNRFDDWKYFRRPVVRLTGTESVETENGVETRETVETLEEISRDEQHLAGGRLALTTGDSFSRADWGLFRGTLIDLQISKKSSSALVTDVIQNFADVEILLHAKSNAFVDLGIAWKKETPWMTDKFPWTVGIAGFLGDNPMEFPEEEASFLLMQGTMTFHHTFTNRVGSIACSDLTGKHGCKAAFDYPDTLEKSSSTDGFYPPGELPVIESFTEFHLGITGQLQGRIFDSKTGIFGETEGLPLLATFSAGENFYIKMDRFESMAFLELETPISRFVTFFVNGRVREVQDQGGEEFDRLPFGPIPQEGSFFSVESGIRVFATPKGI